jgi:hypothetical protein
LADGLQNAFGIHEHVAIPETQHAKACLLKPLRPMLVGLDLISVLPAIELEDESNVVSDETRGVFQDRLLPKEFHPLESAIAQISPQQLFCARAISAQTSRPRCLRGRWLSPRFFGERPLTPTLSPEGRGSGGGSIFPLSPPGRGLG